MYTNHSYTNHYFAITFSRKLSAEIIKVEEWYTLKNFITAVKFPQIT